MFGLIRRAELNIPQSTWMLVILQPLMHVLTISTLYWGVPSGSGLVGACLISILDLLQCSSTCDIVLSALWDSTKTLYKKS
jgi:hypothetical protein